MSHDPTKQSNARTRREFMASSAAVAAAAALGARPLKGAYAQEASNTLTVGLVGCGGRGTGAAREALRADPNTRLIALAEPFRDRVESCLEALRDSDVGDRVQVNDEHKFTGLDSYKGVIENCEVVLLAEPPAFRPEYLRAAVEAGRHVFCEKPVAVDPKGVRHVLESARMAKEKGLALVSGLCYRYEHAKRDTLAQIHDGALGEILQMETNYYTGGLWHRGSDPSWSELEYQLRNWVYFNWLGGDHINEQHIHSLDKIMWVMQDEPPVRAIASGGRSQRIDPKYGNVYDHFNTTFEWENGVRCFSGCRQWESSSTDVSDHILGMNGTAHLQEHLINFRDGRTWHHEKQPDDNMYQNEHDELFAAIRAGEAVNDGDFMCKSTMMAIMARISAYTGKRVTWDEVWNSDLDLMPKTLEWGPMPVDPVPIPGAL